MCFIELDPFGLFVKDLYAITRYNSSRPLYTFSKPNPPCVLITAAASTIASAILVLTPSRN